MGVVESYDQLQAVFKALSQLKIKDFEVLDGAAGIDLLNSERQVVSNCFLGDMEEEMVHRYLKAVKHGQIVFAATVDSEHVPQAALTAKAWGATDIVHFGSLVITNY
jgi:hypothetical protein